LFSRLCALLISGMLQKPLGRACSSPTATYVTFVGGVKIACATARSHSRLGNRLIALGILPSRDGKRAVIPIFSPLLILMERLPGPMGDSKNFGFRMLES